MWIQLTCPNGHPVKVDGKFAGRTGRCPACAARVQIPRAEPANLSEDAILDILGPAPTPPPATPEPAPVHQEPRRAAVGGSVVMGGSQILSGSSTAAGGSSLINQPTRICPACNRRVSVRYQICPHCRTYLPMADAAAMSGIGTRGPTLSCPGCGVTSFPGATVCGNCGEPLG